ncbi:MAG: hypothetical protein QOJ65_212 [Fimbriimonadaceae bacterium]|jgi:hypothetical protein|nr:hypothetical protein [Fimbriimonadaceae bacterium]
MNVLRCLLPVLVCVSLVLPASAQYPIGWSAHKNLAMPGPEEPSRILNVPGGGYYVDAFVGGSHVLFKLDASGAKLWSRAVPGEVGDMAVNGSGVVLAGLAPSAPGKRLCVAKFDGSGNRLWLKILPGGTNIQQVRTALDPAGNVVVSAWVYGVSSPSDYDGKLIKLDGVTGNTVFNVQTATADVREQFMKVMTDSSGSIYVMGRGPIGAWLLRKYGSNGALAWEDKGVGYDPDLQVDSVGNSYLVTGSTVAETKIDITKFNASGAQVWGTSIDGLHLYPTTALAPSGDLVVVGRTSAGLGVARLTPAGAERPFATLAGFAPANVGKGWVSVDAADNAYVASFSNGAGQPAALHKFALDGGFQWSRVESVTSPSSFDSRSVVVDPAGRAAFLTRFTSPGPTHTDIRVTAFDGDGNAMWVSDYDFGKDGDVAVHAESDGSGTTYMIGRAFSVFASVSSPHSLVKFSSTGGVSWSRRLPDLGGSGFSSVGPFVGPGGVVAIVRTRTTGAGISLVQRYDASGNLTWKYDSFPGSQFVMDAQAGSDGSIYLAMAAWAPNATGGNNSFLRVIKLNPSGGLAWTAEKTGGITDWPNAVAVDASGNTFVSYSFQDVASGNDVPALAKFNAAGTFAWSRLQGVPNYNSYPGTVQVDASGSVFAYATVADPANVNRSIVQLAKYDTAGNLVWSMTPLGGNVSSDVNRLSIDGLGNSFVQGQLLVNDQPTTRIERISPAGAVSWDGDFISRGSGGVARLVPDQFGGVAVLTMIDGPRGLDYQLVKVNATGTLAFPSAGGAFTNGAALYDSQLLDDRSQMLSSDAAGNLYATGSSYGPSGTLDLNLVKFAAADSQFISQTVPTPMVAGQTYLVSETFRNTGFNNWTAADIYRLRVVNGSTWGVSSVSLGDSESIAPGQLRTFKFYVYAPMTPGTYSFQCKMGKGATGFGAPSTMLSVMVSIASNASRYVSQIVPTSVRAGSTFSVTIRMRNVGSNTWTRAANYALAPVAGYPAWGVSQVLLTTTDSITRGSDKVSTFTCTAPASPGNYNMRWRMKAGATAFGDQTTTRVITVTP